MTARYLEQRLVAAWQREIRDYVNHAENPDPYAISRARALLSAYTRGGLPEVADVIVRSEKITVPRFKILRGIQPAARHVEPAALEAIADGQRLCPTADGEADVVTSSGQSLLPKQSPPVTRQECAACGCQGYRVNRNRQDAVESDQ